MFTIDVSSSEDEPKDIVPTISNQVFTMKWKNSKQDNAGLEEIQVFPISNQQNEAKSSSVIDLLSDTEDDKPPAKRFKAERDFLRKDMSLNVHSDALKPVQRLAGIVVAKDKIINDKHTPKVSSMDDFVDGDVESDFKLYIEACITKMKIEEVQAVLRRKVRKLLLAFKKSGPYSNSAEFRKHLRNAQKNIDHVSRDEVLDNLAKLFKLLESNVRSGDRMEDKITRLEADLDTINMVIENLEQEDVDFSDDDNSSYIKMQKYRDQAALIFEKISKLRNKSWNGFRETHKRLDFFGSKIPQFNHAINRKFKNNFPTLNQVKRLLKSTVSKENIIPMKETEITEESERVFKKLGELMQARRQKDLYLSINSYLPDDVRVDDPARNDPELQKKFAENKRQADERIKNLMQSFVEREEQGDEPYVTSGSEESCDLR